MPQSKVAIMGNLLPVAVYAANIHNTKPGILPAREAFEKYSAVQRRCRIPQNV